MKKILLCLTVIAVCTGIVITVRAQDGTGPVTLKTEVSRTVLYTVARGHYAQVGKTIKELYAVGREKEMESDGGDLRIVYLNNPHQTAPEHWLYEVQIPVQEQALMHAGTLGEMMDVKRLPEMKVATIRRPEIMADPTEYIAKVYDWISTQNVRPIDNPIDLTVNSNLYPDFSQMQSEIMIPIEEL